MSERVGRIMSLEVGVADEASGKEIESLMMGEPSPRPGSERAITDGSVMTYLRSFKALEPSASTGPSVWVNFAIRYDENAAADAIAEWLLNTLKMHGRPLTLRVNTSEAPLEIGPLTEMVRGKVESSL